MDFSSPLRFLPSTAAPVVAVHCSASSPRQWDGYRSLLDPEVPFITPELSGYGAQSTWPSGKPVTLQEEAKRILETFPQDPVDLVGHSYGAAVALQVALMASQRVRSLILYEPVLFGLLRQDSESSLQAEEIGGVARRLAMLSLSGCNRDAAALFVNYWSVPGTWAGMPPSRQAAVAASMPKVRAEFEAIFNSGIRPAALQDMRFPVRVLCGDRSPAPSRRVSELLKAQLPFAQVTMLQGARHMTPLAEPGAMAPLLFPFALRSHSSSLASTARSWNLRSAGLGAGDVTTPATSRGF
jgi:pimeloyl-ACP methyl ester carboxylesterase